MKLLLFLTPFLICLLVSALHGRWGVRCQACFMIYAGLLGGAVGLERLYSFLNGSPPVPSVPILPISLVIVGIMMFLFARSILRVPSKTDIMEGPFLALVSAMSIGGLIIALFTMFWFGGILLVRGICEMGIEASNRYSRGGGTVVCFYGFLAIVFLLAQIGGMIYCFGRRHYLTERMARRLVDPTPKRPHPLLTLLILLLFCGLLDIIPYLLSK